MRPTFLLGEVLTALRRNTSMVLSVVIVTMVSAYFLGFGLLANWQVGKSREYWLDKVQASVFLCTDGSSTRSCASGKATPEQRDHVREQLEALQPDVVRSYTYVSQDDAYLAYQEKYGDDPVTARVPKDALPESFRIQLADPGRGSVLHESFESMPGVERVADSNAALAKFFTFLKGLGLAALALAAVMVACAVLLMSTTIRQTAFNRRREIAIMRLVGASKATINLPFLVETALAGLVGSALAVAALWATVRFGVNGYIADAFVSGGTAGLVAPTQVWDLAPWLLGGALVVSLLTAWLSIRRHVKV